MTFRCRCCRALLAPADPGPLCARCAAGQCPRGRAHRRRVVDVDGRVRVQSLPQRGER